MDVNYHIVNTKIILNYNGKVTTVVKDSEIGQNVLEKMNWLIFRVWLMLV
jgi:hypothetical protein